MCITLWQPLWLEWFKEFLSPNPCHCPSSGNCSLLYISCDFESVLSLQNKANELGLRSHQERARLFLQWVQCAFAIIWGGSVNCPGKASNKN